MHSNVEERFTFRGLWRDYLRNFVKNPAIPKESDSNETACLKVIQLWLQIQKAQRKVSRLQFAALEREERLTRMSKSLKRWKALAKRAGRCAREWESTAASYQEALHQGQSTAPAPNTIPVPRASVLVQIYRNVYAAGLDGTGRRITAWDELTPSEQALQEGAMDAVLAALSPFLAPAANTESLQSQLAQAHRERLNAEQAIDRLEVARQAEKESLRNNHANELQGLRALLADAERRVTQLTRDNEALCGERLEA